MSIKKGGKIALFFITAVFLLGLFLFGWWRKNTSPVSPIQEETVFIVTRGSSTNQIGEKLYDKGLIRNPFVFRVYVQFLASQNNMNFGEFILSPSMNISEIVDTLQGKPVEIWITIPEGLRLTQMVEVFVNNLKKSGDDAEVFRREFLEKSQGREGLLFPDTYLFPPDASASLVVDKMSLTFELKVIRGLENEINESRYGLDEIMIMASIIEREAKTNEERPLVAGILWKRIETPGWLMQADATLQYAVANARCPQYKPDCNWWPILTKEDMGIDSYYNSYKHDGLPPAPIASPGLSSIKAALNPQLSDYWFYIHDLEGKIHFAKTLDEHNINISKYLRR